MISKLRSIGKRFFAIGSLAALAAALIFIADTILFQDTEDPHVDGDTD